MNARQRFHAVMGNGVPDRVPYFEEPLRRKVLDAWRRQGLPAETDPVQIFPTDRHDLIEPGLEPLPEPARWPASECDLGEFQKSLDPDDKSRMPADWKSEVTRLRWRTHVAMLRAHRGLFLSLGVHDWQRFEEAVRFLADEPRAAGRMLAMQGEFAAAVAERVLRDVEIDAAVFSEPISDAHGPLVSPAMYEKLVLRSYEPVLTVLRQYDVRWVIFMTYANSRLLLPRVLGHGFNCLWAYEVNTPAMDYRELRREFGEDLRLIGGIDLDSLRAGREAVRREILGKVPPLLEQGGYIPLADGRVREDVPYGNYVYFRELLHEVTGRGVRQVARSLRPTT